MWLSKDQRRLLKLYRRKVVASPQGAYGIGVEKRFRLDQLGSALEPWTVRRAAQILYEYGEEADASSGEDLRCEETQDCLTRNAALEGRVRAANEVLATYDLIATRPHPYDSVTEVRLTAGGFKLTERLDSWLGLAELWSAEHQHVGYKLLCGAVGFVAGLVVGRLF